MKSYLPKIKPPLTLEMMRKTKEIYDPNGIMNPYKVI
jgi:FAD/FMN-containing dehydrogenase